MKVYDCCHITDLNANTRRNHLHALKTRLIYKNIVTSPGLEREHISMPFLLDVFQTQNLPPSASKVLANHQAHADDQRRQETCDMYLE
jgi:hypothetical protein